MWATIVTVLETVKSFWKLVSKNRFPKLKDFALNALDVWNHIQHMCESTCIFYVEASQIYSKNRN